MGDCTARKMHYVYSVNFPVQVLKPLTTYTWVSFVDHTKLVFWGRGGATYTRVNTVGLSVILCEDYGRRVMC